MLKAAFVLALVALVAVPARADESADLVVGSVRDQRGSPIVGADVVALDAAGRPAGHDRSDRLGTFVISPARPARALDVRCRHCRTTRLSVHGTSENVAVLVTRYAALEGDVPSADDLAALPYGRIVDALGLIPFTLPSGTSISDRGLGGGRSLVLDDGAPLVDLSLGTSAVLDFPDRYVRTIDVAGPEVAYRYGLYAGGGIFALDQRDAGRTAASFDSGTASSLTLEPSLGEMAPAAAVSSDGGTLARRADIDFSGPFAGGSLRAGFGSAAERIADVAGDSERDVSTFRLNYATASRQYLTFADVYASDVALANDAAGSDYRSGYLSADFRLEHPGPVTLTEGANLLRQTGTYTIRAPYPYALYGRANDATAYVEARAGDDRANVDAGLALTDVAVGETLVQNAPSGTHIAFLPSLIARVPLGYGAYARAGFSESVRVPTLLESTVSPAADAPQLERGELEESAIGFDGGRVRGEAIAYREFTHGFDERRLDGLGLSLVWQVAPLVSVRAWSLRASPLAFATPAPASAPEPETGAGRQVLWSTYANGEGLRLDAIVHRDAGASGAAALAFDAAAFVPVLEHLAVGVGTVERVGSRRRYYAGLRARR